MAIIKKTVTSVGEDVEKLESSYIDGRNVKWWNLFRKQFDGFLECLTELPYDKAILLLGIYLKEMKTYVHQKICTQMFITGLFFKM